jgi:mono/diheme cytochrome c family protein
MTSTRRHPGFRTVSRYGIVALLVATLGGREVNTPAAPPAPPDLAKEFRESVGPFLEKNCVSCHGGEKPKGDVDLRRFKSPESIAADFAQWEAVLEQLRSGEMPPKDAKVRPTPEQRQAVIAWGEAFRASEARRNAGDPGVVLARRLSNAEYDNTVRDLTGFDFRPARDFPVDPANAAGFDNTGESLTMSPALVTKYLAAARSVADHLLLTPDGFRFAPFPVITDTDRDKCCVRLIVDFYLVQPTNLADYFRAAWHYRHRKDLGRPNDSLADCAAAAKVSPKYLAAVWPLLAEPAGELGPVAALQALWNELPSPRDDKPDALRRGCEQMRDFVTQLRERVKVKVENLTVPGMNSGAQALVLWKNQKMATNRRAYGGGGLAVDGADLGFGPGVAKALTAPQGDVEKKKYEAEFTRFCALFPDAFYVKERGRVFLDPRVDRFNTGRLLSAGLHNQVGYFRDDQPLRELILDDAGRKHLDALWDEFDFASDVPARMFSGHIWFERSESTFISAVEFDPFRAEDKDVSSPAKFRKFAELYVARTKRATKNETAIQAVKDHLALSEANLRRVERMRKEAEPAHVKALQDFAERAYRRPLTTKERAGVADFYRALRAEGLGHEDAVRDTLASVLMSPHFCFRVDLPLPGATGSGRVEPLDDYALANRLSYFLWSSMPDRELLECAASGTLRKPEVLKAQARRMLKDERAWALAANFGGSWLDFRRFEEHNAVDRGRYPQFDDRLRKAMADEPVRFLLDALRGDRPVTDLLDGKHTFVNAPLAKHYGIPFTGKGDEWVRVEDATKYGRGGLLPMAVFLTKNAPGLRTSPVKRGYWVVTRLLGERIPPPPPNVPEIPADEKKLTLSLRETLAKHREHPSCAGCHARFDSFGLAFEGFGPVGERRTADLGGNPVDTRVTFPGGAEGDGVAGLRDFLKAQRRDAFLDNLDRKLLAYGLGRGLIPSDDTLLAEMRANLAANGERFGMLLDTIVTSPQFRNRRAAEPKKE